VDHVLAGGSRPEGAQAGGGRDRTIRGGRRHPGDHAARDPHRPGVHRADEPGADDSRPDPARPDPARLHTARPDPAHSGAAHPAILPGVLAIGEAGRRRVIAEAGRRSRSPTTSLPITRVGARHVVGRGFGWPASSPPPGWRLTSGSTWTPARRVTPMPSRGTSNPTACTTSR